MAFPPNLATKRNQHRLHLYLHAIVVQSAMELTASDNVFDHRRLLPGEFDVHTTCFRERKDIVFPVRGVLHDAIYNPPPKRYLINLADQPVRDATNTVTFSGFAEVNRAFHKGVFLAYNEAGLAWVKRNVSTDYAHWPPIANFCRVVRNAIVHGGTINTRDENAPTVSWEGVSYNRASFGRVVLDQDLAIGDLIMLSFAFNEELNELGAPLDLG